MRDGGTAHALRSLKGKPPSVQAILRLQSILPCGRPAFSPHVAESEALLKLLLHPQFLLASLTGAARGFGLQSPVPFLLSPPMLTLSHPSSPINRQQSSSQSARTQNPSCPRDTLSCDDKGPVWLSCWWHYLKRSHRDCGLTVCFEKCYI